MTKLAYVVEFERGQDAPGGNYPPLPFWGPNTVVQAPVDYTAAHAESSAFAATTTMIRVQVDTAGFILIGKTPVATSSAGTAIAANTAQFFLVRPGDKVSFI